MGSKPVYCWDTSVFIAWLASETDKPLADIGAVVEEVDNGKASMVVANIVLSEMLEIDGNPDGVDEFRRFLRRSNVVPIDGTVQIAERAGGIRRALKAAGRHVIRTPDATIVATAILMQADVLHTFDDALLKLDGDPVVDGLRIKRPRPFSGQTKMF